MSNTVYAGLHTAVASPTVALYSPHVLQHMALVYEALLHSRNRARALDGLFQLQDGAARINRDTELIAVRALDVDCVNHSATVRVTGETATSNSGGIGMRTSCATRYCMAEPVAAGKILEERQHDIHTDSKK